MTHVDGLDLVALQQFFDTTVADTAGPLRAELVSGGRSNLTYRLTDGVSSWILRRPPLGPLTPSAHDMGREFRIVEALGRTTIPVAPTVAYDDGALLGVPFSIVGLVEGVVLRYASDLDGLPDETVRQCGFALVDTLSKLHGIRPDDIGLAGVGNPEGFLNRQVRRWNSQWHHVRTRSIPAVDELHTRVARRCPTEHRSAVVHGDFRIDNVIVDNRDPTAIRAVIDWEMATLGDPIADLAVHLVCRDPAFSAVLGSTPASTSPRMPSTAQLAARYETSSGTSLPDLDFYIGLAYYKLAVVAEGIYERHSRGDTRGAGFESAGDATVPLAEAGLEVLSR